MKLLKVFMISILTFILLGSSVFAATGKVTGSKVRIREKADASSKELSIATQGETVEVIGEEGDWYKVNFEKYTGYMSKEYIDTDFSGGSTTSEPVTETPTTPTEEPEEPETPTETPAETPEEQPSTPVETTPSTTDVEASTPKHEVGETVTFPEETSLKYLPNFSSREIAKAGKDSNYIVAAVLNNWIKVTNDTNSGWVLITKINGENQVNTPPAETPEEPTPPEENTPTESGRKGTVNVESARVRIEPDGEPLGSIKEGTEVTILGEEGDWLHISTEEYDDCYIAERLITEK